jgi:integrative and conjugative element protein (TIGR02256 family)
MLLGYWSGADVVVLDVIGPGPNATRTTRNFHPDALWQEQELARRYTESGRRHTYLGDWHVHPGGSTRLSPTDRRTLALIARHAAARAPQPLLAIVAPDPDGQIDLWCFAGRWRSPRSLKIERYPHEY